MNSSNSKLSFGEIALASIFVLGCCVGFIAWLFSPNQKEVARQKELAIQKDREARESETRKRRDELERFVEKIGTVAIPVSTSSDGHFGSLPTLGKLRAILGKETVLREQATRGLFIADWRSGWNSLIAAKFFGNPRHYPNAEVSPYQITMEHPFLGSINGIRLSDTIETIHQKAFTLSGKKPKHKSNSRNYYSLQYDSFILSYTLKKDNSLEKLSLQRYPLGFTVESFPR